MKKLMIFGAASLVIVASAFRPQPRPEGRPAISLSKVGQSPEFPGATLKVGTPAATKVNKDSTKLSFAFEVSKYDLKAQTTDNGTKSCANSKDGQHIHFILDNQPYKALYEPKNDVVLANNTEHYLLCFLSRSYHEALKNKEAAVMVHFKIDENGNYKVLGAPKTPLLFYSRPKGDYIGKDTGKVLLDYFIYNGKLSKGGYKVMAEISNTTTPGRELSTELSTWEANFIENLGTGKCKVALTLVDKKGNKVNGPMSTAVREFNLSATDVLKK